LGLSPSDKEYLSLLYPENVLQVQIKPVPTFLTSTAEKYMLIKKEDLTVNDLIKILKLEHELSSSVFSKIISFFAFISKFLFLQQWQRGLSQH
jgi:hypothetical protein